jgi:hypothetical protein
MLKLTVSIPGWEIHDMVREAIEKRVKGLLHAESEPTINCDVVLREIEEDCDYEINIT